MNIDINIFKNNVDLSKQLTKEILEISEVAIARNGKATFILCGGTTPKFLYKKMSNLKLPWEKINITTSDEHCFTNDNSIRNDTVIKMNLLRGKATTAKFDNLPNIEKSDYFLFPIDLLILGLGIAGHIAGIFPDAIEKKELLYGLNPIYTVSSVLAKTKRVSCGLTTLIKAKNQYIYILGKEKLDILLTAFENDNFEEMPVRAFLRTAKIFWAPK